MTASAGSAGGAGGTVASRIRQRRARDGGKPVTTNARCGCDYIAQRQRPSIGLGRRQTFKHVSDAVLVSKQDPQP